MELRQIQKDDAAVFGWVYHKQLNPVSLRGWYIVIGIMIDLRDSIEDTLRNLWT